MPDLLQNIVVYLGSFLLVLSVVVFVHEFGHFQVARWRGVAIDTFSIGFGKTLLGWRDRQGVQWKVGALPLGGYVKFADDADAMSSGPREKVEDPAALAEARAKGLFHAQSLLTRTLVVAAGPVTNFIFAIFAFALLVLVVGRDQTEITDVPARLSAVAADSAASAAGLQRGDVIVSVDGNPTPSFLELQQFIGAAAGREVALQIERDGAQFGVNATPQAAGGDAERGVLGVSGPLALESERNVTRYGPIEAIGVGARQTWQIVALTGAYIGGIFTGQNSGRDIAGPLGILSQSGQVTEAAISTGDGDFWQGLANVALALLGWAAILSVAVGIVNLLPIPILDGGHLLFYGIEAVRGGKPLPPAAQEWAYRAGFAVMASLFLFATWNDVTRLFPGVQ